MGVLAACCCWHSLKTGSRASAFYTIATSVINFIIDIYALYSLYWLDSVLADHEKFIFIPRGIIPIMYVKVVCDLIMLLLSLALLIGINRGYQGKPFIYSWVWGLAILKGFELFIAIFVMAWLGSHRFHDIVFVAPQFIPICVYWILDKLILVVAVLCVISYWQDLEDELYGKAKRVRYLTMLSNIRQARSGTGMSMRSLYSSRATLNQSQASMSLLAHKY